MGSAPGWLVGACVAAAVVTASGQDLPVIIEGQLLGIEVEADGSATLVVNGRRIAVAGDVPVAFPGRQFRMREVAAHAPAVCRARGETGLLVTDRCLREQRDGVRPRRVAAHLTSDDTDAAVAGSVTMIGTRDQLSGPVTFISLSDGYLRVGGEYGADKAGTLLRLNDPTGSLSVQQGRACGSEGNCSPDVRFAVDAAAPAVRFKEGPMACVPAAGPWGSFCEDMDDAAPLNGGMVPIRRGDHLVANGILQVLGRQRVFVAHRVLLAGRPERRESPVPPAYARNRLKLTEQPWRMRKLSKRL
jgi:hypothetical protein